MSVLLLRGLVAMARRRRFAGSYCLLAWLGNTLCKTLRAGRDQCDYKYKQLHSKPSHHYIHDTTGVA
ncbi:MAG: hypothetical protein ABJF23_13040 [Bryobacteraceae bacterium]